MSISSVTLCVVIAMATGARGVDGVTVKLSDLKPKPPPPPPPPTTFKCLNDQFCSLNGVCNTVTKTCTCSTGWTGLSCETLNVQPAVKQSGLRMINVPANPTLNGTIAGNTSTWGGAVLYDPVYKRWFMWASEMKDHCGMHTWTTNSQTVRASSTTANGSYVREAVQFPIWSHEVDVVRAPSGQYVAYFSTMATGKAPACTTCTDGSTNPSCVKMAVAGEQQDTSDGNGGGNGGGTTGDNDITAPHIEVSPPTYMSYSLTNDPRGNWSKPELVLMPKPMMDINAAPVILANGNVIGMWRDHHPSMKYSTPHSFTATNWSDPSTYKWSSDPLFSDKVVKGAIEDMFLWVDKNSNYHVLFHLMYGCDTCGSHAYSSDGITWVYTGVAYTAETKFTDGTSVAFPYCERPHLVFDVDGTTPLALTNGVKLGTQPGIQNDDQSYTLLRPLV